MGAFDREPKLTDSYKPGSGEQFVIWAGEYIGREASADFGENHKARVLVANEGDGIQDRKWYTVWGVLAEQVKRAESDDWPSVCKIEKDGRANTLVQVAKGPAGDEPNF